MVKNFSKLFFLVYFIFLGTLLYAQDSQFKPREKYINSLTNDIGFTVGTNIPLSSDIMSDVELSLTYAKFFHSGMGVRASVAYSPTFAEIDNVVSLPLKFIYKTSAKSNKKKVNDAINSVAYSIYNDVYNYNDVSIESAFFNFFYNLFNNAEFMVGLSPTYIMGNSGVPRTTLLGANNNTKWYCDWTEKKSSFTFSIDAGVAFNFRVWRFDLKVNPIMKFFPINTLVWNTGTFTKNDGMIYHRWLNVNWVLNINGGLVFKF